MELQNADRRRTCNGRETRSARGEGGESVREGLTKRVLRLYINAKSSYLEGLVSKVPNVGFGTINPAVKLPVGGVVVCAPSAVS